MKSNIWLIGAGNMAIEYSKVLSAENKTYTVIGRGGKSANIFRDNTGVTVIRGGLKKYLDKKPETASKVIVCVGIEKLAEVAIQLLQYSVKNILIEKPAGINYEQIKRINNLAQQKNAKVFIAYNRRFYASVIRSKKIIEEDGGTISFYFNFTEIDETIRNLNKADGVKEHWFLANSTHVVDLAFYLGGSPERITCYTSGSIDWHPSASIFTGAGIAKNGALFSYHSNWESPGRWKIEVCTKKNHLFLCPLETLRVQKIGSFDIMEIDIDKKMEYNFKPGLYRQVINFLDGKISYFCTIKEQLSKMDIYYRMAGYK